MAGLLPFFCHAARAVSQHPLYTSCYASRQEPIFTQEKKLYTSCQDGRDRDRLAAFPLLISCLLMTRHFLCIYSPA